MKKRTYISIDGGYLTYMMRELGYFVSADNIERAALACMREDEELWRILFYHCREFEGRTPLPVSGDVMEWSPKSYSVVDDLARKDFFAVRLGTLSFRGWRKKSERELQHELTDEDFSPVFEQKGVDMRIGLDMALLAETKMIDRLILITADTDLVPALKICRQRGIQVVMVEYPDKPLSHKLLEHADLCRQVEWPEEMRKFEPRNPHHYNAPHSP